MTFQPIEKHEARGNSPALPLGLLIALADWGEGLLIEARRNATHSARVSDALTREAYRATRESWGGVTIDVSAGQAVSRVSGYAVTTGVVRESVRHADATEHIVRRIITDAARSTPPGQFLGVFHDDDKGTIDFDTVYLTDSLDEAIAVGVARHATGGIYDFATGDGVWVPHLAGSR